MRRGMEFRKTSLSPALSRRRPRSGGGRGRSNHASWFLPEAFGWKHEDCQGEKRRGIHGEKRVGGRGKALNRPAFGYKAVEKSDDDEEHLATEQPIAE